MNNDELIKKIAQTLSSYSFTINKAVNLYGSTMAAITYDGKDLRLLVKQDKPIEILSSTVIEQPFEEE